MTIFYLYSPKVVSATLFYISMCMFVCVLQWVSKIGNPVIYGQQKIARKVVSRQGRRDIRE